MDLTISRPVKILALILVLAGVGGIASLSMLGKSSSPAAQAPLSVAQVRARAHHQAAPASAVKAPVVKHPTTKPPVVHVTAPTVAAKPPVVRKPVSTVAANGLPIVLADALRMHHIVVVSIFDPQSQTDSVSYAEARAGADEVRAGFLGVSVLDDTVAGPLTAALPGGGLLPVPGLLVYRAPGTLVQRIDGFADRDSVAQLVLSAKTAPALTVPAVTTPAVAAAPAPVAPAPTTTP